MEKPDILSLHRNQLTKKCFSKLFKEYYNYLINLHPDIDWKESLYLDINNMQDVPRCKVCGNPCIFISVYKGYRDHCSKECSYKDSERQKKIQDTMQSIYGVTHALQNDEFKNKSKETCVQRYNNPVFNNREKMKKTCIEKYGGVGSASNIIKEKVLHTRRNNRLQHNIIQNQIGYNADGLWIMRCDKGKKCNNCDGIYTIKSSNYFDRIRLGYELCTKLNPVSQNNISNTYIEGFIKNILKEYNIEYIENDRTILSGKELDIYIPRKKLAIECNGVFWHSCDNIDDPQHHINKWSACKNKEIQLLTIWEDWIRLKPNIVKSIILSKLGVLTNKIYARKCILKYIDKKIARLFLESNHIQGNCNSSINIGLYYNNELVSVMCFAKRSKVSGSKTILQNEYELIRFCNKLDTIVIGAASKLLKKFIKDYNPHIITSFSCNDISNGSLYNTLGFETNNIINKSYWYIEYNTFKRYHRSHFSKTSLRKKGYDITNKTEHEIMMTLPYWKIYDSGTVKWEYKLKENPKADENDDTPKPSKSIDKEEE